MMELTVKRSDYNFEEVRARVESAIHKLWQDDLDLIDRNVNERSITHRLAIYVEEAFSEWEYHCDCEYNRNYSGPKRLKDLKPDDTDPTSTYPDIVLHKRRSNEENLLVIEVKKTDSPKGTSFDKEKLQAFTSDEQQYKYRWGLFLRINRDEAQLVWYQSGSEMEMETVFRRTG
jgi:hypothetical protein